MVRVWCYFVSGSKFLVLLCLLFVNKMKIRLLEFGAEYREEYLCVKGSLFQMYVESYMVRFCSSVIK
jgi:hypothetical protein